MLLRSSPNEPPQDPELGQTKLVSLLNLGLPHINGSLCTIVLITFDIRYRVLNSTMATVQLSQHVNVTKLFNLSKTNNVDVLGDHPH